MAKAKTKELSEPGMIRQLRDEHGNVGRLLKVLEHQLRIFDSGKQPDYQVLGGAAEYFTTFPDQCHHPKEDIIYRKLRERAPLAAEHLGDLEAEHGKIAALARHFKDAVGNVLAEVEMPRSAFDAVLRHFITAQREHMKMEEEHFFPLALEVLPPGDWAEIEAKITSGKDPLFSQEVAEEFEALRAHILDWELEDEAESG